MAGIDEKRTFAPVRIAIVTISDTRTLENDKSGQTLVDRLTLAGHELAHRSIVTDDIEKIRDRMNGLIGDDGVEVVITTGGTGLTGRDVTPEALEPLFDKKIDGFGELFRQISYEKVGTSSLQSRAIAGIAGGTYLFAVPGSPNACKDAWDGILRFQLDLRHMPCNLPEMMPRLLET